MLGACAARQVEARGVGGTHHTGSTYRRNEHLSVAGVTHAAVPAPLAGGSQGHAQAC
jgi:hypothetical protein